MVAGGDKGVDHGWTKDVEGVRELVFVAMRDAGDPGFGASPEVQGVMFVYGVMIKCVGVVGPDVFPFYASTDLHRSFYEIFMFCPGPGVGCFILVGMVD